MVEEPIDLSVDFEGWAERVSKTDADMRAYRFHRGVCVECGRSSQQCSGNEYMPGVLTHCDTCFLKLSKEAAQERYRLRQIEKPKLAIVKGGKSKENWYE